MPLEVYNAVSDLIGSLRPKMTLYCTAQEAYEAACELERLFKAKLGPGVSLCVCGVCVCACVRACVCVCVCLRACFDGYVCVCSG